MAPLFLGFNPQSAILRFWLPFMLRCRLLAGFLLSFALFFSGCSAPRQVAAEGLPKLPEETTVPRSREANDVARFLAGLPGTPGSPYAKLEESEAWEEHRRQLDATWAEAESELLPGLRKFQTDELSDPGLRSRTVFYPFSGPDVLTATLYFPHNPLYVMVALEPAGTLPTPRQIERKDLAEYLGAVRGTMASELGRSFFITRQMDRQFRGQVTDGLLTPILQLLARSGHTVLGFRYVRLDEAGQVIDRTPVYKAPTRYGNKGVEIEFKTDADSSVHHLFYFSVNLSNDRLRENKPFQQYLSLLTGPVSMLKATSYMPHHPGFSIIRDALVSNSYAVLQDDSGVPFQKFAQDQWRLQLYGDYNRPYGSFKWMEQDDLRKAYKTTNPKPLPMHVGYGYRQITSNLLLATRLKAH
jgi:hypothetical protein